MPILMPKHKSIIAIERKIIRLERLRLKHLNRIEAIVVTIKHLQETIIELKNKQL